MKIDGQYFEEMYIVKVVEHFSYRRIVGISKTMEEAVVTANRYRSVGRVFIIHQLSSEIAHN
jgi:hypothetical protein